MSSVLLEISSLAKSFGGNQVLSKVNMKIEAGEIVGLLGPNGSGKSTLLNAASGFMAADAGRVCFGGIDIQTLPAEQIVSRGMARTFQLPSMPSKMSVLEVLMTAGSSQACVWRSLWPGKRDRQLDEELLAKARELLSALMLEPVKDLAASSLSGSQKKLLSIACALMKNPKFLMLDEPTAGVHPNLRRDIVKILRQINVERGITQLIVEHDMFFVREVCTRCVVLDRGEIVADCRPDDLIHHPRVIEAYLGQARVSVQTDREKSV
ncbi:MAG: ABC transporter ATP-binding protein [Burkholderiaceae bacterium]|nr:ABC transporter ATP-binding protein [Burkholderiaceae bacterium]